MRRRRRGRRRGMSTFRAGVIGIVVVVLITYAGFTKFANPFASQYTVKAIFPSANGVNVGSLVRVAGINVGKVTSVQEAPGGGAAEATMALDDNALPLHADATFAIRPRIFLEDNFFVDVSPGSPSAPIVDDGHTFPVQQGTIPVQIDQLFTSLQGDTRHNLQLLLNNFGTGLRQGAGSFNASIDFWKPAYQYSALVNHASLGYRPHDLSTYVDQGGQFAQALDQNPRNLQSLITDLNTTARAFATQSGNLQAAVGELPNTLGAGVPALRSLDAAIPSLRRFARAFDPGVRSSGPAIDASLPFVTQLRLLVRPSELGGLTKDLASAVPALATLTARTIPLMKNGVRPLASCVTNDILPWSHQTIPDSNFNAGNGFPAREVYIEGVDFLPGLAGESRDIDANGPYVRILLGGGTLTYSLQPGLFGTALAPLTSVQPQLPPGGHRPPLHPNVPCETQAPTTDLTAASGPPLQSIDTSKGQVAGAGLLNRDSQEAAITMMRRMVAREHLPYRVPDLPSLKGSSK